MRILPHHQDTGGFFVAVLEKVASLPWESESSTSNKNIQNLDDNKVTDGINLEEEAASQDVKVLESKKRTLEEEKKSREPQKKRRRDFSYKEDPFVFFKDDTEDVWQSIK